VVILYGMMTNPMGAHTGGVDFLIRRVLEIRKIENNVLLKKNLSTRST
jgi:hypothetical protein